MKAIEHCWAEQITEQYFHVALFIMLHKLVLTFKSVDETQLCDHSEESYWAEQITEQYFHKVLFIMLYKVALPLMKP